MFSKQPREWATITLATLCVASSASRAAADIVELPNAQLYGKILKIDARAGEVVLQTGCASGSVRRLQWSDFLHDEINKVVKIYFDPACEPPNNGNPRGDTGGRQRPQCDNTSSNLLVRFKEGGQVWPKGVGGIDMDAGVIDLELPNKGWFRGPADTIQSIEIATVCEGTPQGDSLPRAFKPSPQ